MSKSLPFFKMYPKDFDTDESARLLDMREAGLYLFCLNHSWINNGLPEEPEEIARALKIPYAEFKTAWVRVSRCFSSNGGRLVNKRQEEERNLAIEKSEKARASIRQRYERSQNVGQTYNERTTNGLRDSSTDVDMESRARADFNATGENSYERTYERSGNVEVSYEERSTNESIRASGSESVSKDLNPCLPKVLNLPFAQSDVDRFESVWQRWKRQRKGQGFQTVLQTVIGMERFDWERFHQRAELYLRHCETMEPPWKFASLSLWDWIEGGMILPPNTDTPKTAKPSQQYTPPPKFYWTPELNAQADALNGDEQSEFIKKTQSWINEMNSNSSGAAA